MAWQLLSFFLVLGLIPMALWLLRRTPIGGGGLHQVTRTVGVTALGPHERLVTVEVGQGDARQWLVLGVTAHGISHLHTMAPQPVEVPQGGVLPAEGFAGVLARLKALPRHGRA